MIQKKYVFQTMDELDSIASKITENDAYRTAAGNSILQSKDRFG